MAFLYKTGIGRASSVKVYRSIAGGAPELLAEVSMIAQDWSVEGRPYTSITADVFMLLSDAQYTVRRDDFILYVNNQYGGLNLTSLGSINESYETPGYI